MKKIRVLFVCIHNSGRSQMAEAFLNSLAPDRFEAESAGLEPGTLNPLVVDAMGEIGIDISRNRTKNVFDVLKKGRLFSYVITVCDETNAERCPLVPGTLYRINWSFEDPASLSGTPEEKMNQVRTIRDRIWEKVVQFINQKGDIQ